MNIYRRFVAGALIFLTFFCLFGCSSNKNKYEKLEDLSGATLGVVTGSLYDGYSRELFPNAKIVYYKNFSELLQALKNEKIDSCMLDKPNYNALKRSEPTLSCFDVPAYDVEIGFGFQKNEKGSNLQLKMNNLLEELWSDGTMDVLVDKWYGEEEPTDSLSVPDFSKNKTNIRVAIDVSRKPFVYYLNGEYAGLETEVFYMFCEKYGYNPTIENVSFASGITGLNAKKYDVVVGGVYMTDERKLAVNFSKPYMNAGVVMVRIDNSISIDLFKIIKSGFNKTFIAENRWLMIVDGIKTTVLITILSAILGSILGFSFYMLCRTFDKVAKSIIKVLTTITNGTPAVVILMILYYVVFGKSNLSGVSISIIGFSLIFAAFVCEKLTVSVNGVDKFQNEAALAMGFTDNDSFFNIILPQALKTFMPLYRAEISALVKSTSIVGYIAVQDLTQVSDIIRSNTYEALFPLVSSAIIYIILSFMISQLIGYLIKNMEPKNRNKVNFLKGVNTK